MIIYSFDHFVQILQPIEFLISVYTPLQFREVQTRFVGDYVTQLPNLRLAWWQNTVNVALYRCTINNNKCAMNIWTRKEDMAMWALRSYICLSPRQRPTLAIVGWLVHQGYFRFVLADTPSTGYGSYPCGLALRNWVWSTIALACLTPAVFVLRRYGTIKYKYRRCIWYVRVSMLIRPCVSCLRLQVKSLCRLE